MTTLHAGLLCTCLLLDASACLFSAFSAAQCKMRRALALCSFLTALVFAPLAALLARLPECAALNAPFWTAAALALTALSFGALAVQLRRSRRRLSPVSIKESCDHLPSALCFAWENGLPCLKNLKMDELSHLLMGEALLNANAFWQIAGAQPIVTLENGQTWSFERVRMQTSGRTVYQITGTNITEEARLQRELEKDNLRLETMNRRLRQYGQAVQEATREKEILRAKTRVHDEIGHALLQTRQFLSGTQGDAESVCAAWRQNVRLLLGKYTDEQQHAGTFDQLSRAAQAIGVTIARTGTFPAEGTEGARLVEIAAHECLTNLVRHAGGSRLEIAAAESASGWTVAFRNDGAPPSEPIVEGSGLSSLRAQVEAAGGVMTAAHAPRFLLTLFLPKGGPEFR